eukprot:scpid104012/ scgid25840/ 
MGCASPERSLRTGKMCSISEFSGPRAVLLSLVFFYFGQIGSPQLTYAAPLTTGPTFLERLKAYTRSRNNSCNNASSTSATGDLNPAIENVPPLPYPRKKLNVESSACSRQVLPPQFKSCRQQWSCNPVRIDALTYPTHFLEMEDFDSYDDRMDFQECACVEFHQNHLYLRSSRHNANSSGNASANHSANHNASQQ